LISQVSRRFNLSLRTTFENLERLESLVLSFFILLPEAMKPRAGIGGLMALLFTRTLWMQYCPHQPSGLGVAAGKGSLRDVIGNARLS
jgi:hypothetical protein